MIIIRVPRPTVRVVYPVCYYYYLERTPQTLCFFSAYVLGMALVYGGGIYAIVMIRQ